MCKKRGHAGIYSPKDTVKPFSLIGMVSGKRGIIVVALEPEEGNAKFYHEAYYCFTKMIVLVFFFFFLQKIESHWSNQVAKVLELQLQLLPSFSPSNEYS